MFGVSQEEDTRRCSLEIKPLIQYVDPRQCNHGPENSGASKLRTATSPTFVVKQRGLKVLIKNRKESAFGDTGAGQNVISERRREELGLEMRPQPTSFPMGNSKRIFSPGIVDVPIAFEDDPTNVMTVVAHVVHTYVSNFFYLLFLFWHSEMSFCLGDTNSVEASGKVFEIRS